MQLTNTPTAKIILHSGSLYDDSELITMEIELHRFILPEFNTHRSVSRNFQSSRACPVTKQLEQILANPAMPLYYGKNQSGMQAKAELSQEEIEKCKEIILSMRDFCLQGVNKLHKIGLHKQTANRYIEPWLWTKGVVTATKKSWEAFFTLRCSEYAQPEIRVLAENMRKVIEESTPNMLDIGDYHLPYVDNYSLDPKEGQLSIGEAFKVSTSCCAQVSYRVLDDSLEKALKIYDMLHLPVSGEYPEDPPHFSPCEHQAMVAGGYILGSKGISIAEFIYTDKLKGNFSGSMFTQHRKYLELGLEKELMKKNETVLIFS